MRQREIAVVYVKVDMQHTDHQLRRRFDLCGTIRNSVEAAAYEYRVRTYCSARGPRFIAKMTTLPTVSPVQRLDRTHLWVSPPDSYHRDLTIFSADPEKDHVLAEPLATPITKACERSSSEIIKRSLKI